MRYTLAYTNVLSSQSNLPALLYLRLIASRSPKKNMSLKAEEPTVDVLDLFPKGANAKPKEGEIRPSGFFKLEAGMSCALSKIAPIGPTAPRRLGMRQFFTEEAEWKALAGETFPGYSGCLRAARLEAASRQALEELILKFLQILLHAEPSALLFY